MLEGSGFKCGICHSTHHKFKYKLAFVARDGDAEAKMVAFDHVAARIVDKPVHQLIRAGKPIQEFPPELHCQSKSFRDPEKSYRVLAMLATQGRQASVPRSVVAAGTSRVQTGPTNLQQQQPSLGGEISQTSAEPEVPKDSASQQTIATAPQTTFGTIDATPPDCSKAISTGKRDSARNPGAKNKRPEGNTSSAPGTKKTAKPKDIRIGSHKRVTQSGRQKVFPQTFSHRYHMHLRQLN